MKRYVNDIDTISKINEVYQNIFAKVMHRTESIEELNSLLRLRNIKELGKIYSLCESYSKCRILLKNSFENSLNTCVKRELNGKFNVRNNVYVHRKKKTSKLCIILYIFRKISVQHYLK